MDAFALGIPRFDQAQVALSNQIETSQTNETRASQTVAIAVRGLDFVFQTRTQQFQALKAVDLTVPKGTVQMIMGPSGAGKTTLLLVIAGLLTPIAGQVELMGQPLIQLSRSDLTQLRLQQIGIAFQDNNLLRSLTALENVEVMLKLKGVRGQAAKQQAEQLLIAVGLSDKINHLPRQLSGGQQQRVAVARALAGHPQIIIADEPTAALDSENGQIVVELLRQRSQEAGCTVLIATHDPRIVEFADRIAYLEDGVITSITERQS